MYPLVPYNGLCPVLQNLLRWARKQTIANRQRTAQKIDAVRRVSSQIVAHHQDTLDAIKRARQRARLTQRGVAATESLDVPDTSEVLANNLNDAEIFVLKKAYRQAAALAHPDRGGSADEFQAVHAAYRAKDHAALTEYLLSKQETSRSQLDYWMIAVNKPDIDWVRFQSTPEYFISRLYTQGKQELAIKTAGELLQAELSRSLLDEFKGS